MTDKIKYILVKMAAKQSLSLKTYKFVKIIGIGSSGIVSQYTKDGIDYAIKIIDAVNLTQFISQEIAVLSQLNSYDLSIPHIYDHGFISNSDLSDLREVTLTKTYYGIVMEYIEGMNLDQYVETFGIDDDSIHNIAVWLLDLLRHLHQMNIVHRDIKPSNIIFRPDSRLYLVDFGFACSTTNQDILCSTQVIGNPYYLAPEGWSGYIDNIYEYKGMDVWAVGVMLFNLNYGDFPFTLSDDEMRKYDRRQKLNLLGQRIREDSLPIKYDTMFPIISMALTKNKLERPSADKLYQIIIA
jgi:serine/threonine protein kinase